MTDRWRDPEPYREAVHRTTTPPPRSMFADSPRASIATAIGVVIVLLLVVWAIVSFNAPEPSTTTGAPRQDTTQPQTVTKEPAPSQPGTANPEPSPAQ